MQLTGCSTGHLAAILSALLRYIQHACSINVSIFVVDPVFIVGHRDSRQLSRDFTSTCCAVCRSAPRGTAGAFGLPPCCLPPISVHPEAASLQEDTMLPGELHSVCTHALGRHLPLSDTPGLVSLSASSRRLSLLITFILCLSRSAVLEPLGSARACHRLPTSLSCP